MDTPLRPRRGCNCSLLDKRLATDEGGVTAVGAATKPVPALSDGKSCLDYGVSPQHRLSLMGGVVVGFVQGNNVLQCSLPGQ